MTHVLRQSTQVIVRIGPFMDATDAVTPETGITLAAADQAEALKAAGAATVDISGDTWAAIANCGGWYDLTLTTTDTNTIGDLTIVIQDTSVCLPVFARFQVIEEAAYDTIYAASALPASTTNITAGTVTTATNVTTVNGLAANVITAASMADDASTEIANKVWDTDATGHQTQGTFGQAIGDPAADTNTIFKAVVTDAAGATVGVDVVAVKADTAAILDDTGTSGVIVASLAAGSITAAVIATAAIDADAIAADAIGASEFAQAAADKVWATVARTLTAATNITSTGGTTVPQTGDSFARIGANGASLTAIDLPDQTMNITGNITGNLSGSVGSLTTNNDKTGYRLSATGVDDILDEAVDGAVTLRESIRLHNSPLGGKLSGAGTGTESIRDLADTKDRIVATVDSSGNRTAITRDLT